MKRTAWMVLCAGLLAAQPAWAMRTGVHEAAESPDYGRKFGGMIGRGVLNAATCFVDVLVNVVNDTKAGPPVVGTLTGAAKGVGCGVLRLGSGAVDLVTFWVPGFNGFPVSDSYDNCLATSGSSASMDMMPTAYSPPAETWTAPAAESSEAPAPAAPSSEPPKSVKKVWKK